jgi:hypothetical protein
MILVDGLGADDTERRARWAAMKRARSAELEAHEAHAQRGDRTDTTERTGPRSAGDVGQDAPSPFW